MVDVGTTVVEVNGRVLLARDMLAQGAAIHAKTATETTLTVDVPAGEAVMVRTLYISFAAGGGFWHGTSHTGWSVLLPGGRYCRSVRAARTRRGSARRRSRSRR